MSDVTVPEDQQDLQFAVEMYQHMPNAALWVVPGQEHYSVWPAFGGSADAESVFCPVVVQWLGPEEA